MRKIRVLRDFTTTHALALDKRLATEREPGRGYAQPKSIVVAKEAKFVAGEEIETARLQGDGEFHLVSSRLDGRQYAILDALTEGKDYEFVG